MARTKGTVNNKEKEIRKRAGRKYGQARRGHAKKGIGSCFLGGATLLLMVIILLLTYLQRGNVGAFIGALGWMSLILSWMGVVFAMRGFREREKNYLTCRIGITCNTLFVIGFILIFLRGLM